MSIDNVRSQCLFGIFKVYLCIFNSLQIKLILVDLESFNSTNIKKQLALKLYLEIQMYITFYLDLMVPIILTKLLNIIVPVLSSIVLI